ncbi:MAG: hypothetical protein JWO56_1100 [Acidobacteria bacterium]|nr:hypothetical protein [Acidobacteriota bacterium]
MRAALSIVLLITLPLSASAATRRRAVARASGMIEVKRVMVVVLENEDAVAAEQQPYLAALASRGALLRDYHALTHPSQPNYIALTAGSAYGVDHDDVVNLDVPHLGDLLEARGVSWKVYAENYPGNCFLGAAFGNAASGQYARKHVPFIDYGNVQNSRARCTRSIVDSGQLDSDVRNGTLPRFALYVPNMRNDGHDTGVAFADAWLQQRFEQLLADPRFSDGLLFVVVFDEGRTSGPNTVYCSLSGAGIRPGSVSNDYYDHYDLLRTIEEIFHTATLGHHDDHANVIQTIWR